MQDDSSMKKFITLINQHIAKQRDKYTGLIDKNNKELRALNKLKSLMLSNAEDKILNRTINKTQGEFYQKFKTVSNFMKGETIKEKLPTLNVEVKPLNELEYKCLEEKRLFAGYKKPDNKIKGKSMSVVPDPNFRLKSAAEFYIQEKKMLYKGNKFTNCSKSSCT